MTTVAPQRNREKLAALATAMALHATRSEGRGPVSIAAISDRERQRAFVMMCDAMIAEL